MYIAICELEKEKVVLKLFHTLFCDASGHIIIGVIWNLLGFSIKYSYPGNSVSVDEIPACPQSTLPQVILLLPQLKTPDPQLL